MFGLMVFGAGALYLGLMFWVARWAWRKGRANSGSTLRASVFAVAGFLAVYLPVFWNHVPVLLAHRSMCAKDAGFKAYVVPEKWREQNRDRIAALRGVDLNKTIASGRNPDGTHTSTYFGGLLVDETTSTEQMLFGVQVGRVEVRTKEKESGALLASTVNYQAGHPDDARFWLAGQTCDQRGEGSDTGFKSSIFRQQLRGESQ